MTDRRKLTLRDKLEILVRQSRCPICGEKLGAIDGLDFDHEIALVNGGTDTNSNLRAVHRDPCHRNKTHGLGGTKRITTAGSDRAIGKKADRLSERYAEMRRVLLAPTEPDQPTESTKRTTPKTKWPKRPFPKRPSAKDIRQ